MKLRILNWHNF